MNIITILEKYKNIILLLLISVVITAVIHIMINRNGGSDNPTGCNRCPGSDVSYKIYKDWKGIDLQPEKNRGWKYYDQPCGGTFGIGNDPTHGAVCYGKYPELFTEKDNDRLRIDVQHDFEENKRDGCCKQRKSIRLSTEEQYNDGLFIISASHIPAGHGVWPSFWLSAVEPDGNKWACHGEIDIIEGVNSVDPETSINASTLHTNEINGTKCIQDGVPGVSNGGDCQAGNPHWKTCGCDNKSMCPTLGCGVHLENKKSFGQGFNENGGGVYVCELTKEGKVTIWFFEKDEVPCDITCNKPDPSKWSDKNTIKFKSCPGHFQNLELILNTTLCGDWAGSEGAFKLPGTNCLDYVWNPANLLEEAYWDINFVKIFKK